MRKHIMIPDCQVTPDTPTDHLRWIGEYIVEQKPDAIINIGDFADMESLSFFDKGKRTRKAGDTFTIFTQLGRLWKDY